MHWSSLDLWQLPSPSKSLKQIFAKTKMFWSGPNIFGLYKNQFFKAEFCSLTHVQKHLDQKKDGALVPLEAGECNSAIPFLCVHRLSFSLRVILDWIIFNNKVCSHQGLFLLIIFKLKQELSFSFLDILFIEQQRPCQKAWSQLSVNMLHYTLRKYDL